MGHTFRKGTSIVVGLIHRFRSPCTFDCAKIMKHEYVDLLWVTATYPAQPAHGALRLAVALELPPTIEIVGINKMWCNPN